MNRTIKFKGKSLTTGEWLYGSHFNDGGEDYILPNVPSGADDYERYQVDLNTVGQFVIQTPKDRNKFDKDGNYADFYDLYEDDIVQARESFIYYNSVYPFQCKIGDKFVLSHYDAGFCLVPIKTYKNWDKDGRSPIMGGIIDNYELWNLHSKFVPIGNIHDNKELLKKEA